MIWFTPHPEGVKKMEWDSLMASEYWNEPQNTLFLAASIRRVDANLPSFDDAILYCSPAYEHDCAKQNFIL